MEVPRRDSNTVSAVTVISLIIFDNKGDVQNCGNCRKIKLMSHAMKMWERVVQARIGAEVNICAAEVWFQAQKDYNRCDVFFKDADGEVQIMSRGVFILL